MNDNQPAPSTSSSETNGAAVSRGAARYAREHFIPLRKADLAARLCAEPNLSEADRDRFRQLARLLEATFHFEFHTRLEELKNLYAPFDPDADTRLTVALAPDEREARMNLLFEKVDDLLSRANYVRLDETDIQRAAAAAKASGFKLNVDLKAFQRLAVYARGNRVGERTVRDWKTLYRNRTVPAPQYQRLVVVFRLKDGHERDKSVSPNTLHLKIFKNIPKSELDMLLPGAKVKMTRLDQGKIWLPTVSGIGMTTIKLIGGGSALIFGNVWAMAGLIAGTIGYGAKSFFTHQRTKDKHHHTLTKSLFYQNLDNNAGVLFRLLDEAEEQECREAMLAYFFLWRQAGSKGWAEEFLDRRIEGWLHSTAGVTTDFEADDALTKLVRIGLAERSADGKVRVCPIDDALVKLDRAWDNYFRYGSQ